MADIDVGGSEELNWSPSVVAMANAMQDRLDTMPSKQGGGEALEDEVNELLQAVGFLSCDLRARKTDKVIASSRNIVRLAAANVAVMAVMIADSLACYRDA